MDRTVEKRAAASRSEGHFVPLISNGRVEELRKVKTLTAIDPTDLCSDCSWSHVCAGDRTCWHDERRISAEVARYRRREKRGQMTGTVADIAPISRATGRAHDVGSGETAHEWIDGIERMVDSAERPVEITVEEPLPAANQRLMDVLGVTVNVVEGGLSERDQASGSSTARAGDQGVTGRSASRSPRSESPLVEEEEAVEPVRAARPASSSSTSPCKTCGERPAHWTRGRYSGLCEECAAAKLPPVTATRTPKWTLEKAIAAVQAFEREHGRVPTTEDTRSSGGTLPQWVTIKRVAGSWTNLLAKAGLEPAVRQYTKDSSGKGAGSQAAEEGPCSPTPLAGAPDDQEPGVRAPSPAPLARVAQLGRAPAGQAGEAGSKPAPRFTETPPRREVRDALIGVLDSLRVLVDAVLPEASE